MLYIFIYNVHITFISRTVIFKLQLNTYHDTINILSNILYTHTHTHTHTHTRARARARVCVCVCVCMCVCILCII